MNLAFGSTTVNYPIDILTDAEQKEYTSFTSEQRRQEYLATRHLIMKMSKHAGLTSGRLLIQKDELGKPFGLYQDKHFYLSVAHTDTKVLCALSKQTDVGIDIEPADRDVATRLRKRILHPNEAESLKGIPSIRLWTIKEAAVKLLGCGLRTNLNEIIICPDKEADFLVRFNDEKTAKIRSFRYKGYWISVARFK